MLAAGILTLVTQFSSFCQVDNTNTGITSSRASAVAAPHGSHVWNTLPTDVVAASSLSTFRRLLQRFLFKQSHPDVIY